MPEPPRRPSAGDPPPKPGIAPDTPRPSFAFAVDVPDHWVVLDLDLATQQRWLDAFLDSQQAPREQAGRRAARTALLDYLGQLHREQILLAAILFGTVGGQPISAGVTLAWRQIGNATDSDASSAVVPLEGLRRVYAQAPADTGEDPSARRVEVIELPAGGAVKVTTTQAAPVPSTDLTRPAQLIQYIAPAGDTGWLAFITATTAIPELVKGVESVAEGVATSLRFELPDRAQAHG
jgi:hypothetical protein